MNALKHGLCSSVLVPEDGEAILDRMKEWTFALKPQNEYHGWLVDKISVYTLRIDRCERMERRYRDRRSLRAESAWEDDCRLEAEALGAKIGQRPAQVLEELRRSPAGCDWLISRWSMLAHAADQKPWSEPQVVLAFNLMGTPFEFREGQKPGVVLDGDGHAIGPVEGEAAVARREIAGLRERRELVAELDEVDRSLTAADLFDESNRELKNLRRYDGALHNKFRWCLGELRYVSPHFKPSPDQILRMVTNYKDQPEEVEPVVAPPTPALAEAPAPVEPLVSPAPAPTPAPAKAPADPPKRRVYGDWEINCVHPPFDIEPHEIPKDGSRADLFQILLTRQGKREEKAERRREARRRKAERLRS